MGFGDSDCSATKLHAPMKLVSISHKINLHYEPTRKAGSCRPLRSPRILHVSGDLSIGNVIDRCIFWLVCTPSSL